MLKSKFYEEISPNKTLTGTQFNGEFYIQFVNQNNRRYMPRQSYLMIKATIKKENVGGAPSSLTLPVSGGNGVFATGFSQNAVSCFFDNLSLKINNTQVDKIESFTTTNSLTAILERTNSSNEKNYNNCQIYPLQGEINAEGTANTYVYSYNGLDFVDITPNFGSKLQYQMYKTLYDLKSGSNNDEYIFILCDPFLRGVNEIKGSNVKYQMIFQVDSDYGKKILFNNVNIPVSQGTEAPNLGIIEQYHIYISDVKYHSMFYEIINPDRNLTVSYLYDSIFQTKSTIDLTQVSQTKEITMNINLSCDLICILFRPNIPQINNQLSYFHVPAVRRLSKFQMSLAGQTYPTNRFVFDDRNNQFSDCQDALRAYEDYKIASGNIVDSVLSYREWLQSPIISWHILRSQGDISNILRISLEFHALTGNSETFDIVACCFNRNKMQYSIDDIGLVIPNSTVISIL